MNREEPRQQPKEFRVERVEGELMAVNSFLVHGPDGVVVVDGQLTVDDATKVRAAVHASGCPLAAVLITHPHPDHYAGAGLIAGDAPILATREVADVIERDDPLKARIVGPMMGEQWPTHRRFPDTLVEPGEVVELAGLRFRAEACGPGESHSDTLWWLDEHTVFAGDLAYNGMHAYLADARYESWLAALAALEARLAEDVTLYVGHGEPAGRGALAAQRRYVETFLDAVAEYTADDAEARRDHVVARMRSLIPDVRLLFLMELSIEPVHAALRAHRP